MNLRPCPFCGSPATYVGNESVSRDVYCHGCGVSVVWTYHKTGDAEAHWNRRAAPAAVDWRVKAERLMKALYIYGDATDMRKRAAEFLYRLGNAPEGTPGRSEALAEIVARVALSSPPEPANPAADATEPPKKPEPKPYMTVEQAEAIVMAAEVGHFSGSRSDLTHALLLLEQQPTDGEEIGND